MVGNHRSTRPVRAKAAGLAAALLTCMIGLVVASTASAASGLDTSFGGSGNVQVSFDTPAGSGLDGPTDLAVQGDGKIVALGASGLSPSYQVLARYLPGGTLDPAFGTGGKVVSSAARAGAGFGSLSLQADGKIVIGRSDGVAFVFERLLASGAVDTSFGAGGIVSLPVAAAGSVASFADMTIDPAGRIVGAGTIRPTGSVDTDALHQTDGVIVRVNSGGSADGSFGTGGIVRRVAAAAERFTSVSINPDGRVVVAGQSETASANSEVARASSRSMIQRYGSSGVLDKSFASAGVLLEDNCPAAFERFYAISVRGDGDIVGAGMCYPGGQIVRYDDNGDRRTSFGVNGLVKTDFTVPQIAFEPAGQVVAAGLHFETGFADAEALRIARYSPTGTYDPGFAASGRPIDLVPNAPEPARGIGVLPDRRIAVAAGGLYAVASGPPPHNFSVDLFAAGVDRFAPELDASLIRSARRGGGSIPLDIDLGEAARVKIDGRMAGASGSAAATNGITTKKLRASASKHLRTSLKLSRSARARLKRGKKLKLRLTVSATDAAGNKRRVVIKTKLSRKTR